MAKTKPVTPARKSSAPKTPKPATAEDVHPPERVCELLGLPAPIAPPIPTTNSFSDCSLAISRLGSR